MYSKIKLTAASILLCTVWFLTWDVIIFSDTGTVATQPVSIFRQYGGADRKVILSTDSIYSNNDFELSPPFDKQPITEKLFFNKNPNLLLWYFLMLTLSSLSCAFIIPLIGRVASCAREVPDKKLKRIIIFSSFAYCLTVFFIDQGNKFTLSPENIMNLYRVMLKSPTRTMRIIQSPILVAASLSIAGLLLSACRILRLDPNTQDGEDTIASFRKSRNDIGQFLLILGIIVASGSVITTAALRNAINQLFIGNKHIEFVSQDMVYTYSLLLSLFILVIYVPAYFIMANKGKEILERINPFNKEDIQNWASRNVILNEYLGLKSTLKDNITNGLVVISPIASALLSQLIGK
jgi:hypothetical protein